MTILEPHPKTPSQAAPSATLKRTRKKPRLGFLGVGWIGSLRMEAIARSELGVIAGIADPSRENAGHAARLAPEAALLASLDDLLELDLDGLVIATPNAMHAPQAIAALESGVAVFCQKPLARSRTETASVFSSARKNNLLIGVDLSYRFTSGIQQVRRTVQSGELGRIFAVDLVYHNAYGPDKSWFYDFKLAGGGCAMDLGIHLIDLAFWILGYPEVERVDARLFQNGQPLPGPIETVEDYATAHIDLANGTLLQLACSWKLHAGCDAIISAAFHGTNGGVRFRNVNGSFYDFQTERFSSTRREVLASGPDDWGGRAAADWVKRLSEGDRYDPEVEGLLRVTEILDRIYKRA